MMMVMMVMMMMMMVMMMKICFCFFAAVAFAGFAFVLCFSSVLFCFVCFVFVEGVWPLLTHVILAAALESFWLKRFGSSFLAQEWISEWSCQESRTLAALGQQGVRRAGPHAAATMAFLRGTSHQDSVTAAPATGGAAVCVQLPAAEIYEDSHFGSRAAVTLTEQTNNRQN